MVLKEMLLGAFYANNNEQCKELELINKSLGSYLSESHQS